MFLLTACASCLTMTRGFRSQQNPILAETRLLRHAGARRDDHPVPDGNAHQIVPDGETTAIQNTDLETSQDESNLSVIEETVTIGDLVRALNAMGTTPTDLISIIQAIKASGALSADVEMM